MQSPASFRVLDFRIEGVSETNFVQCLYFRFRDCFSSGISRSSITAFCLTVEIKAFTLVEVFRLPGLTVVFILWVLSDLRAYAQYVINERLNFLADCMASRYVRPDIEAKHHRKEGPNCPFHGGNPITRRTGSEWRL